MNQAIESYTKTKIEFLKNHGVYFERGFNSSLAWSPKTQDVFGDNSLSKNEKTNLLISGYYETSPIEISDSKIQFIEDRAIPPFSKTRQVKIDQIDMVEFKFREQIHRGLLIAIIPEAYIHLRDNNACYKIKGNWGVDEAIERLQLFFKDNLKQEITILEFPNPENLIERQEKDQQTGMRIIFIFLIMPMLLSIIAHFSL